MLKNIILNSDSYKASHYLQYPPKTERIYCYIESRGGRWDNHLFFGLQAFLKEYLEGAIVTQGHINDAADIFRFHGEPFNKSGWEHIVNTHGGKLPLSIKAIPEGTVLPTRNALVTVENTCDKCFWLPTYIETALLRGVWYPTTVATLSYHCKKIIKKYLDETSDNKLDGYLNFKLHDFGARGVSSGESAMLGGMAHLVNFEGTDTVAAVVAARKYYNAIMPGFSIPAAEHSTIITWGRENEARAYINILNMFLSKDKVVACVSDSYDLWHAISEFWGKRFKSLIEHSGGTLVVRPDSGNPPTVVCTALEALGEAFGFETNQKGFKVLPKCVRLIQGDGINETSLGEILHAMKVVGWSADNVGFGMGGGLLQQINRDTLSFAMKPSHITIDGFGSDISKSPKDDPEKASKSGRLVVFKEPWRTIKADEHEDDCLVEVFRDGEMKKEYSFREVRDISGRGETVDAADLKSAS